MSKALWRRLAGLVVLCGGAALPATAQTTQGEARGGTIAGRVTQLSGEPIPEALILAARPPERGASVRTDANGQYRIVGLAPGRYVLKVQRLGQREQTVTVDVGSGETVTKDIVTSPLAQMLNEVVTTGGRTPQRAGDMPTTQESVDHTTIERQPHLTPADYVKGLLAVDAVSTSLVGGPVVTRGFNNIFSGALLTLTDYRFASVPSLRVNVPYLIPTTSEDIDKIEVVLGPAAALYGPNATSGIMHIITKSPLESPGTSVTIGAGERSVMRGGVRHAQRVGDKVGFKLSGEWMTGDDWRYVDPAEPPTNPRDYGIRRWAGEARVDVQPTDNIKWITSFGHVNAGSAIELTGTSGAAQVKNWTYSSAQTRLHVGNFFAQAFANLSDAGDTRLLRTNSPIVDQSRVYVGQIQHAAKFGRLFEATYGADYQRTEPRTGGTINGRNEDDDIVTEFGGYVSTITHLTSKFDFHAAARLDENNRVEGSVFSPRAAVLFKPTEMHNFRLAYNHAFTTPSNFNLFLDLPSGTIPFGALGTYRVVALGVPKAGLHFRRDCGGNLCMRSPFAAIPGTVATPSTFLEADATLRWRSAVEIAIARNPSLAFLRGLPAPTKASVTSNLAVLNPTAGTFSGVTAAQVRDIDGLKPSLSNTIEGGYNGLVGSRVRLNADVWHDARRNFVGPALVETPNVFLDSATTAQYLGQFVPAANAQAIAGGLSKIPVGTVSPDHPLTNAPGPDLIVTYRNYGKLNVWGADAGAEVMVTDAFSLAGNYSWVNKDLFPKSEVGGVADVTLNAPPSKAALAARYRDEKRQWGWELRGRYVDAFPVQSGVYSGKVDSYTLLDANFDYKLPVAQNIVFAVNAQNLLDRRHREFVGVPEMGRFVMTQLRYKF